MNLVRGVATHRLISEGGRLGGRHVVIGRLERKLLHLLVLVQVNHLHRKQARAAAKENRKIQPASPLPRLFICSNLTFFPSTVNELKQDGISDSGLNSARSRQLRTRFKVNFILFATHNAMTQTFEIVEHKKIK